MRSHQVGGNLVSDPQYEALSKALNQKYKHLNWVKRGLDPKNNPVINNVDGSISTHRLAWVTGDNGEAYIYPTIIQDPKTGKLIQLDDNEAADYAFETKTAMVIPDVRLAEYYSKNGLIKHEKGGKIKKFRMGGMLYEEPNYLPGGVLHEEENKAAQELGFGKKGLPVIKCDNNKCSKVAEIEKEEWYLQKPQTKRVEKIVSRYKATGDKSLLKELGEYVSDQLLNNTINKSDLDV